MQWILFVLLSFKGRINRRTWLLFFAATVAAEYCSILFFRHVFHFPAPSQSGSGVSIQDYHDDRASMLAALIFLWPSLALDVKRWHDIGKSGYYALFAYGPILTIYMLELTTNAALPEPLASLPLSLLGLFFLGYFTILAAKKGYSRPNQFGRAGGVWPS
jgi:uncharacterized membrane protein YhaH (DUF805 family)